MPKETMDERWSKTATRILVGKRIKAAFYMNQSEAEEQGWTHRPLIIELDDGTFLFPASDDEGNDGGALFTTNGETPVLPVLR